eukprot:1181024-Prorocentrum_minimum.AAC.5
MTGSGPPNNQRMLTTWGACSRAKGRRAREYVTLSERHQASAKVKREAVVTSHISYHNRATGDSEFLFTA